MLPSVLLKNPSDWIILDNGALLSFLFVHILSVKAFVVLDFRLVVRNNWWGDSSSKSFPLLFVMLL